MVSVLDLEHLLQITFMETLKYKEYFIAEKMFPLLHLMLIQPSVVLDYLINFNPIQIRNLMPIDT